MTKLAFLFLMALLVIPVSCSSDRDTTTEAAREPETRLSDADIEDRIETRIKADDQFRNMDLDVDADANENRVTLSGTVDTEAQRTRVTDMAMAAHPGVQVENRIVVKPRETPRSEYTPEQAREERNRAKEHDESIGDSIDDAWIHAKIVTKLVGDADVSERKVNVDVNNNVVTLRGTVASAQEKAEAERIAKETDGVKQVKNQLKVAVR